MSKKEISPKNDKGQRHGYWEQYWTTGKIWYKCVYINGKKNGLLEYYNDNNGKTTEKKYHL